MRSWLQQEELGHPSSDRGGATLLDTDDHDNESGLNEMFTKPHRNASSPPPAHLVAKKRGRPQDSATGDTNRCNWQERMAGTSNQKNPETAEQATGKEALIAFDDNELKSWVMRLGEERSSRFLCALAEAVMKADADDYSIIRPALLDLKRRHHRGRPRGARAEKPAGLARKEAGNRDSPPQSRAL